MIPSIAITSHTLCPLLGNLHSITCTRTDDGKVNEKGMSHTLLTFRRSFCVSWNYFLNCQVFLGTLRAAEFEHLMERFWYALTETCLAFTVFRDDFNPKFVALFTVLLFLKSFHWLAEDRVDYVSVHRCTQRWISNSFFFSSIRHFRWNDHQLSAGYSISECQHCWPYWVCWTTWWSHMPTIQP